MVPGILARAPFPPFCLWLAEGCSGEGRQFPGSAQLVLLSVTLDVPSLARFAQHRRFNPSALLTLGKPWVQLGQWVGLTPHSRMNRPCGFDCKTEEKGKPESPTVLSSN